MATQIGTLGTLAAYEKTWRLTFELRDDNTVEIYAHRRVLFKDAGGDVAFHSDNADFINNQFPSAFFKKSRQITATELETQQPGITGDINGAIDGAVVDQKTEEAGS